MDMTFGSSQDCGTGGAASDWYWQGTVAQPRDSLHVCLPPYALTQPQGTENDWFWLCESDSAQSPSPCFNSFTRADLATK